MAREKSVIVGDPMQLPPVVQSNNPFVKKAMGRSIYQVALDESFCKRRRGSYSRVYEKSAEAVIKCVKQVFGDLGIGIITPYTEQSKYINDLLKEEHPNHRIPIKCSTPHSSSTYKQPNWYKL